MHRRLIRSLVSRQLAEQHQEPRLVVGEGDRARGVALGEQLDLLAQPRATEAPEDERGELLLAGDARVGQQREVGDDARVPVVRAEEQALVPVLPRPAVVRFLDVDPRAHQPEQPR